MYNILMKNTNISKNEIIKFFKNKEIDKEWSFIQYKPSDTSKWTNCYHRYPAKFIPQLVEKLFDEYINNCNALINDPFMGSGTTIVSSIAKGFKASGTDINKIAYLITKVKATPIEPIYLENKINKFIENISFVNSDNKNLNLFSAKKEIEPKIPEKHIERINYWFSDNIKMKLGQILNIIYQEKDIDIRNFLLVAFSNILKNCSIWLQTSTKPTRDFNKNPKNPYVALKRHIKRMIRGNKYFYEIVPENVKKNINYYLNIKIDDAKKEPVEDNSVDLIVTSSPYVTSYEYADLHQLSTIWLDFADDLTEYKKQFIGTSYKKYENGKLKSEIAKDIINKMQEKDVKMSKEIEAFFIDMQDVINESYRILKNGSCACYVIGDTSLKNIKILNAEVFAELMINAGMKLERIIKREIPSKILPQTRDTKTGRFAKTNEADNFAYPYEYIVIGKKE